MRVLAVAIEDRQDLDRRAVPGDPVRCHGVEFGGLPRFDQMLAVSQQESGRPIEDVEPVASGMDLRLGVLPGCRYAHLGHDPTRRIVGPGQHPLHRAVAPPSPSGADDHVLAAVIGEQLVDGRPEPPSHAYDHARGAHQPHGHGHVHLDEADWEARAVDAELEGELLLGFVTDTARWIDELRGPDAPPVRRVLDIGSGPGVGTCELARRFPDAHVIAVDGSPAMLERATRTRR